MTSDELYKLRFPIGEFSMPAEVPSELKENWIKSISDFPKSLKELTQDLSSEQKNQTYRPEGWNIKQVVHHCADSHMNSLIRFKLALTEDSPTIRPYYEARWAELNDGKEDDLTDSLQLLASLHSKWTRLLNDLTQDDLKRSYVHPEHGTHFSLQEAIGVYAWHCDHHLGHVKLALQ
ncbi:MAG: putative metal-dependent hydrolase [Crocinitomicaceae bacterium]|nr:putative metal-dependent hydrolase [Flavobacteriales bacterium]NQZ37518.1 putative metal-dependent hydrolase [Crocinitomicaceae bacterium]